MRPNDPDLHNSLAAARIHDGRLEEAVDSAGLRIAMRASAILPKPPDKNLGNARSRQVRLDEAALECFQRAACCEARLRPGRSITWVSPIRALKSPQEAAACFQKRKHLSPTTATEWFSLGKRLEEVGDFDGAERCWRDVLLSNDPATPTPWLNWRCCVAAVFPQTTWSPAEALESPHLAASQRLFCISGLTYALDAANLPLIRGTSPARQFR